MKRIVLCFIVFVMFMGPVCVIADEVMVASVSSKQNLLGTDSSMGSSGGAAPSPTFHLLSPDGADSIMSPDGADNIDVVH